MIVYRYGKKVPKFKIHKAIVTDSNIDYEGSCEIDVALLKAANIYPYEQIDIYDISNVLFSTYAIPGNQIQA